MSRSFNVFTKWAIKSYSKLVDLLEKLDKRLIDIYDKDNSDVSIKNMPDVEVSNFPDSTKVYGDVNATISDKLSVSIKDYPEELRDLKVPSEMYEKLVKQYNKLDAIQNEIIQFAQEYKENSGDTLPINADPEDYMNVRITNGEDFVERLVTAIGGGSTLEGLLPGVMYDKVVTSYPEDNKELYKFYLNSKLQNTVSIEYETSDKNKLILVERS